MSDLRLRDATPRDRNSIRAVTLAAYGEYAESMPEEQWDLHRRSIIATLADPGRAEQIVAERDGAIVGSVLVYPAGAALDAPGIGGMPLAWPEVRLLAVDPPARRAGVGTALLRECARRARRSGAASLTLFVVEEMRAVMALCEMLGFVRTPELDVHPVPEFALKGYWLELGD